MGMFQRSFSLPVILPSARNSFCLTFTVILLFWFSLVVNDRTGYPICWVQVDITSPTFLPEEASRASQRSSVLALP